MNRTSMRCGGILLAFTLLVGGLVIVNRSQQAFGNQVPKESTTNGPHYSVLETEGTNLVVTDNAKNTLYFYTVDKGKAPGSVIATGSAFPGRSRPLCAWPQHATYKGQGNPEDAASFECRD